METLLTFLVVIDMLIVLAPFVIWIFIKFASHQGEYYDNKWKIVGIVALISFVLLLGFATLTVYVGFQIDPHPVTGYLLTY